MKFDAKALREKLAELKRYLKKIEGAIDNVEKFKRIMEEIDELEEVLAQDEADEIKVFRLMRMLIEKLKDLGGKVPLLDTFLELYIAALKSTEYFIDNTLKKHGFTGKIGKKYSDIRKRIEDKLKKDDVTDREEIAKKGHEGAMAGIGRFEYERYEEQFKNKYDLEQRKEWIKEELEEIEDDKRKQAMAEEAKRKAEKEAKERAKKAKEHEEVLETIDSMLALLGIIKRLEEKLKDKNLAEEERAALKVRLEKLWKLVKEMTAMK